MHDYDWIVARGTGAVIFVPLRSIPRFPARFLDAADRICYFFINAPGHTAPERLYSAA